MTTADTFQRLRGAIEGRDADGALALYSDDVQLIGYNKDNPPASPQTIEGKESAEAMIRDVFGREMTHRVVDEVIGDRRFSYNEVCEYPGGSKVFASVTCDVEDGEITRQVQQEVWDE